MPASTARANGLLRPLSRLPRQRLRGTGNQVTRPGFNAGKHSLSVTPLKNYAHPVDGALEIRLVPLPGSTRDCERDS